MHKMRKNEQNKEYKIENWNMFHLKKNMLQLHVH